jgi:hypothetical protein
MNATFNNNVPVVVENPAQVVIQDYVTEPTPPYICCTPRTIGLFMMGAGVAVGLAMGLGYGVYSNKC